LSGHDRAPVLPDLPTFKELGFPAVVMTAWYGLWYPAKTPQSYVLRMHSELTKLLATSEARNRLDALGLIPVGSPPAVFARFLKTDIALQSDIVKRAGIPQQ
jgi:tripartite-type tricarboxylate transporter receptor subunit TctC